MVSCPKCKTENVAEDRRCRQCNADLLPGEGIGTRLGYLVVFVGLAVLGGFILYRMYDTGTWPVESECMLLSPIFWGLVVLAFPFMGLYYAFRPTPLYARFLERAKRHVSLDAQQANTDFNQALLLAPEKGRAGILKARADFYEKHGDLDHAAMDRLNATLAAGAYQGTEASAALLGIDSDKATEGVRSAEQERLLKESKVVAIGYCSRCHAAVQLDEKMHCLVHKRSHGKDVRFAMPQDVASISAAIQQQQQDLIRKTRVRRGAGCAVILVLGGLFLVWARWGATIAPGTRLSAEPQATVSTETAVFDEHGFRFEYPADWQVITATERSTLLSGSLKGLSDYEYIGGVYFKGLDNCSGCAQVVIVVVSDPSLPGGMLDEEQFAQAKEAAVNQMGERLISYEYVSLDSLPAAESKHYGRSGDSQLWEYIILPSRAGVGYSISMSADKSAYSRFEPQFADLVDSLQIEGGGASAQNNGSPAGEPASEQTVEQTAEQTVEQTAEQTVEPQDAWVQDFAEPILEKIKNSPPTFADDFSVMSGRFIRWSDITRGVTFPGDVMHLKGEGWTGAGGNLVAADFVLEVELKPSVITSDSGFNVTFRDDENGHYAFGCNLYDDYCEMVEYLGEQDKSTQLIGAFSGTDPNEWRTILVIAQGEQFGFYINGKPFGYFQRDSLKSDWVGIGLWSSPGIAEIDVDNVKFWNLESTAE